jgi:hypothetical protein
VVIGIMAAANVTNPIAIMTNPLPQFFRLYADRLPGDLFDRLQYIIQVLQLVLH